MKIIRLNSVTGAGGTSLKEGQAFITNGKCVAHDLGLVL